MEEKMKAGKFKAECLQVMERVRRTRRKIIITKRDVPVAELAPIENDRHVFGIMKGSLSFKGDVIAPIDEAWNAAS
jgi:prevent-host-death family protein